MYAVNDCFTWHRTFTLDDVEAFARLSGDEGTHHVRADASGRVMVHGLLTATVPTKIGGDLDFVARQMQFEFLRPVFTGDTVHCAVILTEVQPDAGRLNVSATLRCFNQHGKDVLTGAIRGIILVRA